MSPDEVRELAELANAATIELGALRDLASARAGGCTLSAEEIERIRDEGRTDRLEWDHDALCDQALSALSQQAAVPEEVWGVARQFADKDDEGPCGLMARFILSLRQGGKG